jgi:hypothetical protein
MVFPQPSCKSAISVTENSDLSIDISIQLILAMCANSGVERLYFSDVVSHTEHLCNGACDSKRIVQPL